MGHKRKGSPSGKKAPPQHGGGLLTGMRRGYKGAVRGAEGKKDVPRKVRLMWNALTVSVLVLAAVMVAQRLGLW